MPSVRRVWCYVGWVPICELHSYLHFCTSLNPSLTNRYNTSHSSGISTFLLRQFSLRSLHSSRTSVPLAAKNWRAWDFTILLAHCASLDSLEFRGTRVRITSKSLRHPWGCYFPQSSFLSWSRLSVLPIWRHFDLVTSNSCSTCPSQRSLNSELTLFACRPYSFIFWLATLLSINSVSFDALYIYARLTFVPCPSSPSQSS